MHVYFSDQEILYCFVGIFNSKVTKDWSLLQIKADVISTQTYEES